MTVLGKMLGQKFSPWRTVLGDRTLSRILKNILGRRIVFEGSGSGITVRTSTYEAGGPKVRFNKTVWAAFAKPVPDGHRRIFVPTRPFEFNDHPGQEVTLEPGAFEIEAAVIPDAGVPKIERDKIVSENIISWCGGHGLDLHDFVDENVDGVHSEISRSTQSGSRTATARQFFGVQALESLIVAVPEAERKNYSLSLDLIYRLITAK